MCKKENLPEMLRYYPMDRGSAPRLAADERLERFARERVRKFNRERWNRK